MDSKGAARTARSDRSLRILYLSQYFPPEMGAPAARVHECAREWVRSGLDVAVLTGMPHHPTGVVPEEYRGRFYMRDDVDGIEVHRAYVYATPNRGVYRRAWSYVTFMLCAILTGLFRVRRPDVLVATSPQLLAGVAGWVIAALRRVPFVLEVRDLWPESIEAVGAFRNRFVLRCLYGVANFLYARARHIVLVSDESRRVLEARGIPAEKMSVIKNGVDLALFRPTAANGAVRERHDLDGDFVVLYIGTIGMAHGLEVVLDAARQLTPQERVRFLLVGEGARKDALRAQADGAAGVLFLDGRPRAEVPAYIAAADLCLVHLKRSELFKTVIPSKLFEIMGCGKPILLGVEGEAQRLIEEAAAGRAFTPDSADELVAAIRRLQAEPDEVRRLGENGRRFVEHNYSREKLASQYAELLRSVA